MAARPDNKEIHSGYLSNMLGVPIDRIDFNDFAVLEAEHLNHRHGKMASGCLGGAAHVKQTHDMIATRCDLDLLHAKIAKIGEQGAEALPQRAGAMQRASKGQPIGFRQLEGVGQKQLGAFEVA